MRLFAAALVSTTLAAVAAGQPKSVAPKFDPKAPFAVADPGGHGWKITGVAFTPDGKSVVSAAMDRTVRVWDVATGDLARVIRLPGHSGAGDFLMALALSSDGKTIATGGSMRDQGRDGSPIYLINLETGRVLRALTDHTDNVVGLSFAPDGKRLASASNDRTVRIWDVETGKAETVLRGHDGGVIRVAFSPDGKRVATVGLEGTVRVWLTGETKPEHVLRDRRPLCVAWSPDGTLLAAGNWDGTVTLWDNKGKRLGTHDAPAEAGVFVIQFTPDGRELLCAGAPFEDPDDKKRRSARLIAVGNGLERNWIGLHSGAVVAAAVSADGKLAVTGGADRQAIVWRTTDGSVVRTLRSHGSPVGAVAWERDGRTIAWGGARTDPDPEAVLPLERTFRPDELVVGPGPEEGARFERTVRTRKDRRVVGVIGQTKVIDGDDDVSTFDPKTGLVCDCTWLGDDLYVTATQRGLYLVNAENGKVLRQFGGFIGVIRSVAPAPDGLRFVTGGDHGVIQVWTLAAARPLLSLLVVDDEWIAWTDAGLYACSPGGERLMGWQVDESREAASTFVPAARFHPSLYRPEVIKHVVSAGDLDEAFAAAGVKRPDKRSVADLWPPTVEITTPDGSRVHEVGAKFEVTATAKPTGGRPVTALRLLVDGRPYGGAAGVRPVKDGEAKASWSVDLPPGPHTLTAVADSAVSRGASPPVEVRVPGAEEKPSLYVLAVGVSDYPDPYKLRCAAADAEAVGEAFRTHGAKAFRSVEVKVLKNAEANRAGIEAGLAWLKEKATARDVAVVFFSGRGTAETGGEYALLSHGADAKEPAKTGLTASKLTSALAEVRGRALVLLDSSRPRMAEADDLVRALQSEDCAAAVLCPCRGTKKAVEEPGAKLGYFAQALVEGLSGAADADKDGTIWLHELEPYVANRVKELNIGVLSPVIARPAGLRSFPLARP
jgi:WD40 repeat protein